MLHNDGRIKKCKMGLLNSHVMETSSPHYHSKSGVKHDTNLLLINKNNDTYLHKYHSENCLLSVIKPHQIL